MALTTKVNKKEKELTKEQAADKFLESLDAETAAPAPVETESNRNKKPVSTYFRPALLDEIREAAEEDGVSVNTWINQACQARLNSRKNKG